MPEMILNQPTPQTKAEYEIALEQRLTEMKRLREQMNEDQEEIDRLKAETQAIIAELRKL